eukprot:gene5666-7823_t
MVSSAPIYPTKINNVVTKLTKSIQNSLTNRNSRIEIELPLGVDFGVESSSKKDLSGADKIKKSHREAARLVTEMFAILSSTTVVMFPTENEATLARNTWGSKFNGQVFSLDAPSSTKKGMSKLSSRRFTLEEQEAALLGDDGIYIPSGTEVLIIVCPRTKDYTKIKKASEKIGESTLFIIINGRINFESNPSLDFDSRFINVFHYAPPIIEKSDETDKIIGNKELLLYHEYKNSWYLAEKKSDNGNIIGNLLSGGGSPFTTLWEGKSKPTTQEIINIFKKEEVSNN